MKIKLFFVLTMLALVSCIASPTTTPMPSPSSTPLPASTPAPTPYWPTEGWKTSPPEQQKGFWQDEKTFVFYQQIVGQAERTMVRMTFEGDTVTIRGEALVNGATGEFSGKLQK